MIGRETVLAIREQIAPHPAPVLSLYLDVNPANPANVRKAPARKAREALKALELPNGYAEAVSRKLELELVIPRGRTLIVFAGEDVKELFAAFYVQAELPLLDLSDGVLAHWGEPYVAPLLFALNQQKHHALLYVSQERVRAFEVFLGEIEELFDAFREADTESWPRYREARRSPAVTGYVAPRGGASSDRYDARLDAATERFYRAVLPQLEEAVRANAIARVILMGLDKPISTFEALLPSALKDKVIDRLPPPSDPGVPAQNWYPLVADTIERVEAERENALLERVQEQGVWGLEETLALLREHRLSVLVVPWTPQERVYQGEERGQIAATRAEAALLYPEATPRQVSLLEVLPDLVVTYDVKLEFVHGEAEARLLEAFGGLAALKRW